MADRIQRKGTEREAEMRPTPWKPASMLPTPEPKNGIIYRWIRTSANGKADNTNVSRRFREGWSAVSRDEFPELQIMSDHDSRFEGNIEVGGLLLCQNSEENVMHRRVGQQRLAESQMEAVDTNYLRQSDPRMPVLAPERKTRTTAFGE